MKQFTFSQIFGPVGPAGRGCDPKAAPQKPSLDKQVLGRLLTHTNAHNHLVERRKLDGIIGKLGDLTGGGHDASNADVRRQNRKLRKKHAKQKANKSLAEEWLGKSVSGEDSSGSDDCKATKRPRMRVHHDAVGRPRGMVAAAGQSRPSSQTRLRASSRAANERLINVLKSKIQERTLIKEQDFKKKNRKNIIAKANQIVGDMKRRKADRKEARREKRKKKEAKREKKKRRQALRSDSEEGEARRVKKKKKDGKKKKKRKQDYPSDSEDSRQRKRRQEDQKSATKALKFPPQDTEDGDSSSSSGGSHASRSCSPSQDFHRLRRQVPGSSAGSDPNGHTEDNLPFLSLEDEAKMRCSGVQMVDHEEPCEAVVLLGEKTASAAGNEERRLWSEACIVICSDSDSGSSSPAPGPAPPDNFDYNQQSRSMFVYAPAKSSKTPERTKRASRVALESEEDADPEATARARALRALKRSKP